MSAARPAAIQIRNLSKRYGGVHAVRGIDFDVASGEIFGLLGRNGAGKTTTLESILGLRRPDTGSMMIAGIDAVAAPERAKAMMGAQLQTATLQDRITPRQALRFFASFYVSAAPIDALLAQFALGEKADAPFDSLSGGQKQRLFLALAFVHRPSIVVFDEPTAGLDPQVRRELHTLIVQRRAEGVTILLSTHDLDEAEHLCDRIGILHEGRLIALDTPANLIARSRGTTVVALRCARPIDEAPLAALPGVARCRWRDPDWLLDSADVNTTIAAVVQHLGATGNALLDLQVRRPSLEDVFIELTGAPWRDQVSADLP